MKYLVIGLLMASSSSWANIIYDSGGDSDGVLPERYALADDSDGYQEEASSQPFTLQERVAKLEHQIKNLTSMNVVGKIDDLESNLQSLQGQIEILQHQLQTLQQEQQALLQALKQNTPQAVNKVPAPSQKINSSPANNASSPNASKDIERKAYQAAFNLLSDQKYEESIHAFQNLLNKYPNTQYAPNAYYWLGEIFALQQKNQEAISALKTLITRYPDSSKVPDAKLKLALIDVSEGKKAAGKKAFESIIQQYPDTTAAHLARQELRRLGKGSVQ